MWCNVLKVVSCIAFSFDIRMRWNHWYEVTKVLLDTLFRSDLIFCTEWSMNGIELIFRFEDGLSFKSWRIISYSNLIYNLVLTRTVKTFTSSNLDANSYVFIYSSIKFIIINIIISYDDPSIMKALSQFFEYHWTKLTPYFCRRKKEETLKKLNN